ncbi:MAG: hypothetical protein ABEJ04_05345 [Halobacteriaceae archaeon]
MGLADIAAEVGTTTVSQRERGVAAVDDTSETLADGLAPFGDDLPCTPAAAATLLEAYADGATVGEAGDAAGVAPVTAAKALHLVGVEGVTPLGPTGRRVVRDWLDARLSRADARTLTDASETEFALAVFVETHDPLEGARAVVESALAPGGDAMVEKRDRLADAVGGEEP